MSVPESKKMIKDDHQVPRVVQANYLPHFQHTPKYVLILPAAQNGSTLNINSTPRVAGSLLISNIETAPSWCSYLRIFIEHSRIREAASAEVQCTSGKESKGEKVPRGNEHCWMFIPKQGILDVLTLSSNAQDLSNNEECCFSE